MSQHWQRKTITDEQMRDIRLKHHRRLSPWTRVRTSASLRRETLEAFQGVDGMKYYIMLRMEGEFPGRAETLMWEIHEAAYDDFLREFDDYWNRVF